MKMIPLAAIALTALAFSALAQDAPRKPGKAREEPKCLSEKWPLPKPAEGEAYAIDGDTIAVPGLKQHIRLWGIQAPELRKKEMPAATAIETVAGMKSRAALEDEIEANRRLVSYEPTKWDHYCRIVARVWITSAGTGDKVDLSTVMLQKGFAYGFYLDDTIPAAPELSRGYASAEATARRNRVGLWKEWLGEK
ncbi:MAG: thermonuclease family protein [Enhydrobacter sp.]|nr:thermonuclease family protein [Enhydrobacter sp.]